MVCFGSSHKYKHFQRYHQAADEAVDIWDKFQYIQVYSLSLAVVWLIDTILAIPEL